MIDRGEWAKARSGPPDVVVRGTDADLAQAAHRAPGGLFAFEPDPSSDLARSLGLLGGTTGGLEVALDALAVRDGWAVNAVVVGVAPTRLGRRHRAASFSVTIDGRPTFSGPATTVVVAVGEFVAGVDQVPRGHPGDGRAEVQVLALAPGQRRRFRARLAKAEHLPHPDLHQRTGRVVDITGPSAAPVAVDGIVQGTLGTGLHVALVPSAYRLTV